MKGFNMQKAKYITQAALIAALYAALTIGLAPIGYGGQQFRVAEAMAVLPVFTPAAIPGLFLGCILSNILSPMGLPDLIFGSTATLIAALLTRTIGEKLKNERSLLRIIMIPLPAVLINTVIIGAMLAWFYDLPFSIAAVGVLIGQSGSCYGLGIPLYFAILGLRKRNVIRFL